MNPHHSFKQDILDIITSEQETTAKNIQDKLHISQPTLFKHLNTLVTEGKVKKIGRPPKVFYQIQKKQGNDVIHLGDNFQTTIFPPDIIDIINKEFLYISPDGIIYPGVLGFAIWSKSRNEPLLKTAQEYKATYLKYQNYKQDGIINASFKLTDSFQDKVYLDKLFYLDFYAWERFGKTKLAQLTFQAKQSQDAGRMDEIYGLIKDPIDQVLRVNSVDAVAFIPPTIDRKVQFQSELRKVLNLQVPHLNLIKLYNDTPVQQKTLKSKEDRILNASSTIFVDDDRAFENILLIDDFVGSGSTLNETAKKLRQKKMVTGKLYGLALTGSFKGFEVINQV
jgi:hypothetical protein